MNTTIFPNIKQTTGGKYDLKTIENFDKAWQEIEQKIKEIDANFYEVIKKQDD